MNRIFVRIFLSFWIVIALILAVTLRLSYRVASERAAQIGEFRRIDIVRSAEEALLKDGRDGFEKWLRQDAPLPPAQTIYLLDDDGNDLLGRNLPANARAGFRKHLQRRRLNRRSRIPLIEDADGRRYLFLFGPTKPPTLGVLSLPRVVLVIFVAALAISAIVCLLLARYLTKPLKPILRTARQLSEGNLSARVDSTSRGNAEFGELSDQFNRMAQALEQHDATQRDMLRNVSHELRSPLARIMVALELARTSADDVDRHLARIEREAEHMDALTTQILDLARAHAGVGDVGAVDVGAVLQQVAADARFEGEPDNKRIQVEIESPLPSVHGTRELIHSAIDNVVRNALRYSPAGGEIRITASAENALLKISISDDGPGVPAEHIEQLFSPFQKGEDSEGAGVGLALTAQILKWHGGTVSASNRPDPMTGLIVEIVLPVSPAGSGPTQPAD